MINATSPVAINGEWTGGEGEARAAIAAVVHAIPPFGG
jgi:hypothetical protein